MTAQEWDSSTAPLPDWHLVRWLIAVARRMPSTAHCAMAVRHLRLVKQECPTASTELAIDRNAERPLTRGAAGVEKLAPSARTASRIKQLQGEKVLATMGRPRRSLPGVRTPG